MTYDATCAATSSCTECVPGNTCDWTPEQTRRWPVLLNSQVTEATYDPFSQTWYMLDANRLQRFDVLPRWLESTNVIAFASIAFFDAQHPATPLLQDSTGMAIGDDGNL